MEFRTFAAKRNTWAKNESRIKLIPFWTVDR